MTAMPARNPGEILLSFVPGVRDWSGVCSGEPVLVLLGVEGVGGGDGGGGGVAAAVLLPSPWFALLGLGVEVLLSLLIGGLGGDALDWMVLVVLLVLVLVLVLWLVVVVVVVMVEEVVTVVVVVVGVDVDVHGVCCSSSVLTGL